MLIRQISIFGYEYLLEIYAV